jgi:hypothetical protein
LQDKIEVKGKLQFANHDDGRGALRDANEIATANFPFHVKAKAFQELFNRRIEARFHLVSRLTSLAAHYPLTVRLLLQAEIMDDRNASFIWYSPMR